MTHKKKPRNYFYPVAIILAFACLAVYGIACVTNPLYMLTFPGISFSFFLTSTIWIGQVVAGAAYPGRLFDLLKEIPQKDEKNQLRFRLKSLLKKSSGELFGIIIGIVASLALLLFVPLSPLVILITIGRLASLFNRAGRVRDIVGNVKEGRSLWRKKRINYLLAVLLGFIVGVLLIASIFIFVNPVAIAGVAALSMAGVAGVLAKLIFSFFVLSSFVSACSYIGRWFDIILGKRTIVGFFKDFIFGANEKQNGFVDRIAKNKYELLFTFVSVPLGIMLGIVTASLVTATVGPLAFVGFPAVFAFVLVTTVVTSTIAGLGWRIGYSIDQANKVSQSLREKHNVEPVPSMEKAEIQQLLKSYIKNAGLLGVLKSHAGHHHAKSVKKVLDTYDTSIGIYRSLRRIELARQKENGWNEDGDLAKIIRKIEACNPELKAMVNQDAEFKSSPAKTITEEEIRAKLKTYVEYSGLRGFLNGHANHHHAKSMRRLLSENYNAQGLFRMLKVFEASEKKANHWNSEGELAHIIQDIESRSPLAGAAA